MKICPNCGMQNPEENQVCDQCQSPFQETALEVLPQPEAKKPPIKNRIKLVFAIVVPVLLIMVLFSTHIICINHDWMAPTCIEPAQCWKCDRYKDDILGNHDWSDASCTSPKKCYYCNLEDGEPLGHEWSAGTCTNPATCKNCGQLNGEATSHIEGAWEITKKATLTSTGTEELLCSVCSESLDSRSIEKKDAKVDGTSFNFTDKEFIGWMNDIAKFDVGYAELGGSDISENNTLYPITYDGEVGGFYLNHADNDTDGNICAIMVYFDDSTTSTAITAWVGEKIDADFSAEDSFYRLAVGKTYTKAGMTIAEIDGIMVLAPSEYIAEISS